MLLSPIFILIFAGISVVSTELEDMRELALASNNFTLKIQKNFDPQGNMLYSAVSVFIALGMLYPGARGTTAKEMRQVLSYEEAGLNDNNLNKIFKEFISFIVSSTDEYRLDIANLLVSQANYSISDEYKEILKNYFEAKLKEVNFANDLENVIEYINNWVSNKTQGKIPNFLQSLDPSAVIVILNACYFKSVWEVEFSQNKTKNATFYNNGLDPINVPTMNGNEHMFYMENDNLKALKLPYKNADISMVLLLPNDRNGLRKLEQELTVDELHSIMEKMRNISVEIAIPKFKLEYSIELKSPLMKLGMNMAFSDGANFGGISEEGSLKVSSIFHKAFLEVNEEGSEAAGATGIVVVPVSFPGPKFYFFRAEHPFLFFIIDERTGMILFCGRITEL